MWRLGFGAVSEIRPIGGRICPLCVLTMHARRTRTVVWAGPRDALIIHFPREGPLLSTSERSLLTGLSRRHCAERSYTPPFARQIQMKSSDSFCSRRGGRAFCIRNRLVRIWDRLRTTVRRGYSTSLQRQAMNARGNGAAAAASGSLCLDRDGDNVSSLPCQSNLPTVRRIAV